MKLKLIKRKYNDVILERNVVSLKRKTAPKQRKLKQKKKLHQLLGCFFSVPLGTLMWLEMFKKKKKLLNWSLEG